MMLSKIERAQSKSNALVLLMIANLSFIVIGMPPAMLNVAWTHMQDTFSLSLDSLGVLLFVGTAGRLIGSFYSGQISARLGLSRFIVGGSALSVLGLLVYALSPSWPLLVASGFVWGFGTVGINNGVNAFVAAHYPTSRLNWLHAWFGVGATLAPTLATFIIIDLGANWRWSYVVLLSLYALITVLFALTLRSWQNPQSAQRQGEKVSVSVSSGRDVLHNRAVWFVIALFFIHAALQIGGGQLNSSLFIDGRALDPKIVGTWITLYWGSFTAGRFLIGFLVDRVPNRWVLRTGMALTLVATLMIWLNANTLFSFIGLALMGFSLAPVAPTLIADTPHRAGAAYTAAAVGYQFSAAALGSALLPGLGAALAERVGLEVIPPFLLVLALLSLFIHEALLLHERSASTVPLS
jgi:fucose permease